MSIHHDLEPEIYHDWLSPQVVNGVNGGNTVFFECVCVRVCVHLWTVDRSIRPVWVLKGKLPIAPKILKAQLKTSNLTRLLLTGTVRI